MYHPLSLLGSFALTLATFVYTQGQTFTYPTLAPEVRVVTDIIPAGWSIRDFQSGDLNQDKSKDFVLVLEHKAPVKVAKNNGVHTDSVVAHPRMLLVLFRESANNTFRLVEQNNSFILLNDTPGMQDPYQSVKIEDGLLKIDFVLFFEDISRLITSTTYHFKYQHNLFVLVSAETGFFNRSSKEFKEYTYDFEKL
eukprot:gene1009-1341_t